MAVARFDTIFTVAFGSITTSYTSLGTPLANNWRVFKITNNTDGDMLFSFNASTDNIFVPKASFTLYDLSTNAQPVQQSDSFVLALKTQFSIKSSTTPSMGAVWIEGCYAKGG